MLQIQKESERDREKEYPNRNEERKEREINRTEKGRVKNRQPTTYRIMAVSVMPPFRIFDVSAAAGDRLASSSSVTFNETKKNQVLTATISQFIQINTF